MGETINHKQLAEDFLDEMGGAVNHPEYGEVYIRGTVVKLLMKWLEKHSQ